MLLYQSINQYRALCYPCKVIDIVLLDWTVEERGGERMHPTPSLLYAACSISYYSWLEELVQISTPGSVIVALDQ